MYILSICLRVCSIVLTISATLLWCNTLASAEKQKRALTFKNAQTLISGTLWSQILIPIGLLISELLNECLDSYVEGYFILCGACLLLFMGFSIVSYFYTYQYLGAHIKVFTLATGPSIIHRVFVTFFSIYETKCLRSS